MAGNEIVSIETFIKLKQEHLVLDVRSPAEYEKGHIPGAYSQPLFNNEERAIIGTLYKNRGKQAAMLEALNYFGKNVKSIVSFVLDFVKKNPSYRDIPILVHCWRGGMRSGTVCWMLNLFGLDTLQLNGGYKSYRNFVLTQFENDYNFCVIGGKTGSNKTGLLRYMKQQGKHVIDLEGLAQHRGSAFGNLGKPAQPSQEQFENNLCDELLKSNKYEPIWIEDESQAIGSLNIPKPIWAKMRLSNVYYLDVPADKRLQQIITEYGSYPTEELIARTLRITKKLGGLDTKICIQHLQENRLDEAFKILLHYYDKLYDKATSTRNSQTIHIIPNDGTAPETLYQQLMQYYREPIH